MNTFKQFHESMGRRGFLKTLFGAAAAVATTNPAKAASVVAKAANAPWIKMTLEQDFTLFDYTDVPVSTIGKITSLKGKYTPGVSADGSVMIDYNDSAMDMMEVYVKPGTKMYNICKSRVEGEEGDRAAKYGHDADGWEFEKKVFDTISDGDGDGASWLEQQLENDMNESYTKYEKQPDDWKDELAMVDGLEPDQYSALAQKDATDRVKEFLDQAGEIGAEIADHMKDIAGRGYMKAHVLANGTGSEAISNDTMAELRELYNDEDIDYPDEMDSDRWLDGTADNPMDTMAYDQDSYDRDMAQVQGTGEYEQPPGTGVDTSWTDKLGNTLSLSQVYDLAEPFNRATSPEDFKHLLIPTERDPARVQAADIQEPILIAYDGKTPISIIDGQHRLTKALEMGERYIPWIRVDVNSDPRLKQMFVPPSKDKFDKLTNQMSDDYDERDEELKENFIDGKKKGKSRPGRVKRSGASCSGSVTSLRKKAKAGGEKGKMYHWCANMKNGKKKNK